MINLTLPYPPTVNHYWIASGNRRFIGKKGVDFIAQVKREAVRQGANKNLNNRLSVCASVHCPDKRKRDLDNILKALLDSLVKAGVIEDDKLIDVIHVERKEVIRGGKVELVIKELG